MASLSQALDRLNDFVTRKLHEWRTPGLAVALTDRQNLLHLLVAEGGRLLLEAGDERVVMEQRGSDCFYVGHPDFALFLLQFGRDQTSHVVEAFHGPAWYTNERYRGPARFDYPTVWEAYTGHYPAHNPWLSHLRIVLRKGTLVLIFPDGDEAVLVSVGEGIFRVGQAEHAPERIRFDTIIQGEALRATLSNCDYFRSFTP